VVRERVATDSVSPEDRPSREQVLESEALAAIFERLATLRAEHGRQS